VRRDIECQRVHIYESGEGPDEDLDYPAWLVPVWLAPGVVRIEIAAASSLDGGAEIFGNRATSADLPFIELDLGPDAAHRLARALQLLAETKAAPSVEATPPGDGRAPTP